MSPQPSTRPAWLVGCLVLLGASVLFTLLLLAIVGISGRGTGKRGLSFSRRVGLIELTGEVADAHDFLAELKDLDEDPRTAALVVRIDSPGGDVGASQEIHRALLDFRSEHGRPVVASLGSVAASGGYYAACGAEKIVAEPGTLTGSIGVILASTDASELMKKIGVRMEVIKTGAKKDFGAYWRPMSEDERGMLQGVISDVFDQFVAAVAESRELSPERVRELADGSVYSGRQARVVGLVDTLGFEPDAIKLAAEMAGLPPETPTLSKRRFEPEFFDLIRRLGGHLGLPVSTGLRMQYR